MNWMGWLKVAASTVTGTLGVAGTNLLAQCGQDAACMERAWPLALGTAVLAGLGIGAAHWASSPLDTTP